MGRNQNDIDWSNWLLIIIMFGLGVTWPIGLILLFRQLMGYSKRGGQSRAKRHPYDVRQEQQSQGQYRYTVNPGQTQGQSQPQGQVRNQGSVQNQYQQTQWYAQQQAARQAPPQAAAGQNGGNGWRTVKSTTAAQGKAAARKQKKTRKETMATLLTTIGGILMGTFGLAMMFTIGEWWGYWSTLIADLFPMAGFFGAGAVCMFAGVSRKKKAKRYKKYLAYIGKNQEVSIAALTAAMGENGKRVVEDLQDMLDDGVLPMGYIDLAEGMLVLSDAGISQPVPEPESAPEPEPVKKTVEDENAILQEIREVNDAIPDAVMTAKIDRIGEITGKILDYQRSHPSRSGQLRSFLNYYLPTTLKILRAYAQLDAQGIEGENISAAKKRIESMMDQVVDGFEKQLDKLFADDALDITADVQVLENMLRKDGLSGDGMTVGGAPMPEGEGAFSAQQAYLDLKKVADELDAQKKDEDGGQITLQL